MIPVQRKIAAIKLLRSATGCTLGAAKLVVEMYFRAPYEDTEIVEMLLEVTSLRLRDATSFVAENPRMGAHPCATLSLPKVPHPGAELLFIFGFVLQRVQIIMKDAATGEDPESAELYWKLAQQIECVSEEFKAWIERCKENRAE